MIEKLKSYMNRLMRYRPFNGRGRVSRLRKRSMGMLLGTGAGFALAVVLILSLLNREPAPVSDPDVIHITEAPTASPAPSVFEAPEGTAALSPSPGGTDAVPEPTQKPSPTPAPLDYDEVTAYYKLEADNYYNDHNFSSNHYEYTENDLYMLAQLIHGEARGESSKGKIAVGNVVMNRVLSRGYPGSTIKAVITAPGQFSGYSSSIRPSSACLVAARQVLEKEVWVIPQNVYFFNANKAEGENWGSHKFFDRIGGHNFYTESYHGRSRNGLVPPALYKRAFKWPQLGCEPAKRVYRIQYMLNKLGYDVKADSYFGVTTKEALMEFQKDHKIKADGVAGPTTLKALIKAFGENAYREKFL